ncbi:MAG: hypothetical protein P4M00_06070 [Azospirillaceae bacterium]|nr:hypothetical protein [Azospirillaceae bacterium]
MPNDIIAVTYSESVTPTSTTFLTSKPLVLVCQCEIELADSDKANAEAVRKEFQKAMAAQIKTQVKHLNEWLQEKDATIATMKSRYDALMKTFPPTEQQAKTYDKDVKELMGLAAKIENFPGEYVQIVEGWAANVVEQQGKIAMLLAVKKARVTVQNEKAWRIRLGQVVKGVLIVAAVALSIAAIILTAGTTAPVFIALASTGAAIAGISSLTALGKSIVDNANLEQRLLANVKKDMEAVVAALKPVNGIKTSVAKHVTELQNLMKIRADDIRKLQADLQKNKVLAKSYADQLGTLAGTPNVNVAELAKCQKSTDALNAGIKSAEDKIAKLDASNADAQAVLDELKGLGADLDAISTQAPNTVLGNLKKRFSSLDGWTDLGNSVGGLVNAASGVHS